MHGTLEAGQCLLVLTKLKKQTPQLAQRLHAIRLALKHFCIKLGRLKRLALAEKLTGLTDQLTSIMRK